MAKEYLVALFTRKRRVMINGRFMGTTNVKLELQGGPYKRLKNIIHRFSSETKTFHRSRTEGNTPA